MNGVTIVGAGITGLALAFRLKQQLPHLDVTLLEASARPGGNIGTISQDGFQFDIGPNGFLDNKPSTLNLCQALGLEHELLPASESSRRHRFLFWNGTLHKLPSGLFGLLATPLLSWRGKLALAREPFRTRRIDSQDESVAEFFRRRIGTEATRIFVDALVTGIHGGDPELLSMRSAFPRVWQMEQDMGSVVRGFWHAAKLRRQAARARGDRRAPPQRMWSFRTGLGRLPQVLAERLGGRLRCNARVEQIERVDAGYRLTVANGHVHHARTVVLACPAEQQAKLLTAFAGELARELAGIAFAPIAVVAVGYRRQDVPIVRDGFGYIAPQHLRRDVLGVQWCSAIFPDRAPPGHVAWRALCGGWNRQDVLAWSDAQLAQAAAAELHLVAGITAPPVIQRIIRWPRAIPQYFVGHQQRCARIAALAARHQGLILTGNSLHGVAINDCTEQAEIISARIAGDFATGAATR